MRKNTFLSTALVLFLSLCMNITAFASPKTAHEAVGLFQGRNCHRRMTETI